MTLNSGKTYSEVFQNHRGNAADKWEGYLHTYDIELPSLRGRTRRMLEVGVQNGGSLEVFAEYFEAADAIVGVDICEDCRRLTFGDARIHVEIGDAASPSVKAMLAEKYGVFDLILDDGSHRSDDIINTFFSLLEVLAPGGVYIIEDLCCVYWQDFGGGLKNPASPMRLFKQLADVINHEHWRTDFSIRDYLTELGYGGISDAALERIQQIRSISFYNSICVVRTNTFYHDNRIGKRFCRGDRYALGFRSENGQDISAVGESQQANPFNLPSR